LAIVVELNMKMEVNMAARMGAMTEFWGTVPTGVSVPMSPLLLLSNHCSKIEHIGQIHRNWFQQNQRQIAFFYQ